MLHSIILHCFLLGGLLSQSSDGTSTACRADWHLIQSTCYRLYDILTTWDEARSYCQEEDGDLASFSDLFLKEEPIMNIVLLNLKSIENVAITEGYGTQNIWLGGLQAVGAEEPGGGWGWVDGAVIEMENENWADDQPDDNKRHGDTPAACLWMDAFVGKFHDGICSAKKRFLCSNSSTLAKPTSTTLAPSSVAATTSQTSHSADDILVEAIQTMNLLLEELLQLQTPSQLSVEEVQAKLKTSEDHKEDKDRVESKTIVFLNVVKEPPLAMGIFTVDESYIPTQPQPGGADVTVTVEVLGITGIDSEVGNVLKH